jgi:hypothetical protein
MMTGTGAAERMMIAGTAGTVERMAVAATATETVDGTQVMTVTVEAAVVIHWQHHLQS